MREEGEEDDEEGRGGGKRMKEKKKGMKYWKKRRRRKRKWEKEGEGRGGEVAEPLCGLSESNPNLSAISSLRQMHMKHGPH